MGRQESREAVARRDGPVHHRAGRSVDRRPSALHLGRRRWKPQGLREHRHQGYVRSHVSHDGRPHLRRCRSGAPEAHQERRDVQRIAHAHIDPRPEGQGHGLPLCVGEPERATVGGARGMQQQHRPGGHDELAVSPRHHQGAARASGERHGGRRRAHLHRTRSGGAEHRASRRSGQPRRAGRPGRKRAR